MKTNTSALRKVCVRLLLVVLAVGTLALVEVRLSASAANRLAQAGANAAQGSPAPNVHLGALLDASR